jgi:replicative superfamily II helicase
VTQHGRYYPSAIFTRVRTAVHTHDATVEAAVTKISPPPGVEAFWKKWLRHRAATAPFIWPNHREAIEQAFHFGGKSAVMILPTGAGKTTISCLKIASVLGSGKSVVFVAPTHALVEQLTEDLKKIFPADLLGSIVSSDFDRLFATGTALHKIEVMTPEHCLARISHTK